MTCTKLLKQGGIRSRLKQLQVGKGGLKKGAGAQSRSTNQEQEVSVFVPLRTTPAPFFKPPFLTCNLLNLECCPLTWLVVKRLQLRCLDSFISAEAGKYLISVERISFHQHFHKTSD